MKKAELETEFYKLKRKNEKLREALIDTRQVARDCVSKGSTINSVWVIEKVTATIAKVDSI